MKRIIRLTESELTKLIRKVVNEQIEDTEFTPTSVDSITLSNGRKFQVRKNTTSSEVVQFNIRPSRYKKDGKVVPGYLALYITTDVPNLGALFVWDCNSNTKISTSVSRPTGQPQIDEFNASYKIYDAKNNTTMGTPLQVGTVFSDNWTGSYFNEKDITISNMISNYCKSVKIK